MIVKKFRFSSSKCVDYPEYNQVDMAVLKDVEEAVFWMLPQIIVLNTNSVDFKNNIDINSAVVAF